MLSNLTGWMMWVLPQDIMLACLFNVKYVIIVHGVHVFIRFYNTWF